MKNLIYTLALILVSNIVLGQTTSENYVKTTTYQIKTTDGITKAENSAALQDDDKIESVTYLDGLGRPIQSISKQAGGDKKDIITPVIYDQYGRQVRDYLPYVRNNSSLNYDSSLLPDINGDIVPINTFYNSKYQDDIDANSPNPFSEKSFEESPLSRVLEQAAPGADWALSNNHTIKFDYQTNTFDINDPTNVNNDNVKLFSVLHPNNDTQQTELKYDGYYSANQLYKTITKDENWTSGKDHTTEEFKNKQGQVILKRTYDNNIAHDTYYVYDDFGNLTFVLSPRGSKNILDVNDLVDSTVLDNLCYQYRYDYRNRLIEKKIPGKGWEYIVYDVLDHPILTQDANLRATNDWLFTKYDKFDRVIYTGKYRYEPTESNDNSGRIELQNEVNAAADSSEPRLDDSIVVNGTTIFYDNKIIPNTNIDIYTINYYDDYNWDTDYKFEASYKLSAVSNGLYEDRYKVSKTSSINVWDEGFVSDTKIAEDGYIQWTTYYDNKKYMIGLTSANSTPDNGYTTIDHGILLKENGDLNIFENGISQLPSDIKYSTDDIFRVERTMGQVTYYQNDIPIYVSSTPSSGDLIGDGSFYSHNATASHIFIGYSALGQPFTLNAKGLATGSKVRILDTNQWTTSTTYYDQKARPVYSISENNHLNTIDAVSSYFDFNGKVIKSHSTHHSKNIESAIVTIDDFRYDHTGRLLRQEQKINNEDKELIFKNNYDELGQLEQKQVGGTLPNLSVYVNKIGVNTTSNAITKTATNGWGNSGLSTVENITDDGYVSFTTSDSTKEFICGLSYSDSDQNINSIDYGIYIKSNGEVSIYESGTDKGVKTTHVLGNVFLVERRGNLIYYLKNGEPFYVSESPTTTNAMIGDLAMYHNNITVKDLVLVDLENKLQEVDYTYNIRGWLKSINDVEDLRISPTEDMFAFKINYNTSELTGTTLYNGNISETLWKTASIDPSNQESANKRGYDYKYDALNRIVSANFHKPSGVDHRNYYNLSNVSYDRNGNILTLARSGVDNTGSLLTSMDNLIYKYNGDNQLDDVYESGNSNYGFKDEGVNAPGLDYKYDANGNMTDDYNKGIVITYNHLNLPVSVTKSANEVITYTYDATGVKLRKSVNDEGDISVTDYASNFIYKDGKLEFFSHPEGYIESDGHKVFEHVYQYKDHLGNIRLSYTDTNDNGIIEPDKNEIIEENNYYPFGLKHRGYNNVVTSTNTAQKWKFNNREFSKELGLNVQEMDFRQYDPAIGRFNVIDRLSEFAYGITPYRFAFNNPIIFGDPTGLFETRRAARRYRRDNNITGGSIVKQDDGSFALIGSDRHFQAGDDSGNTDFDFFANDGVVESAYTVHDKSNHADRVAAKKDYLQRKGEFIIMSQNFERKYGFQPFEWKESRFDAIAGVAEQATISMSPTIMANSSKVATTSTNSKATVEAITELSPWELVKTHGITKSKKQYATLKASIQSDGITESIKYVIWNDTKFVVDGHHRLKAAKELNLQAVPVEEVQLPFAGYKTVDDLIYTKY